MHDSAILTLVRHGQTPANLDGVWHGSTDSPLTDRGRLQAARVAAFLGQRHDRVAALYSSPLKRARHTAEAIGKTFAMEPELDADLAEYDLGSWEGKTYTELQEVHRLWHHMKRDPDFAPHGGESPLEVATRISATLEQIGRRHRGERVVVVTHGGALSLGLAFLLDSEHGAWRDVMSNCAVSELVIEPEPKLLSFNLTSHLED